MTLCNNNDLTWFSDTLTSARPLRGPADVNALKNMFDPYIQGFRPGHA